MQEQNKTLSRNVQALQDRAMTPHLRTIRSNTPGHSTIETTLPSPWGREKIQAGQGVLDLAGLAPQAAPAVVSAVVESKRSALLWDVLTGAYEFLGLSEATGGDEGFRQMVLARLVEPASKERVPVRRQIGRASCRERV